MALLTDSAVIAIGDLLAFEASLAQVASSHSIDVDTKISLALSAVSDKLSFWLLNAGAADPQWLNRRVLGLSTVVVSPVLHRWLCFESLSRIYAEAYNCQLNTRYQGKWKEYQREAEGASNQAFLNGVGLVSRPLPRPAMPLVSLQSGSLPAQSVFIQTCWLDSDQNESALSLTNGMLLPDSSGIAVGMAEGALGAPAAAVGWNIYAAGQATNLTRQNLEPLSIGATWELPTSGMQIGSPASGGQVASVYVTFSKRISRG